MNGQKYFSWLCITFLLVFTGLTTAADNLAAYSQAGKTLAVLVAKAEKADDAKLLQTEEVDQLVTVLSDEQRFLQKGSYSKDQLGNLLQLCGMSNKAVMSLALFRLKGSIEPKADRKVIAQQAAALMENNAITFGRHLAQLQPFMIRCMARQVSPMSEFMAALDPQEMTPIRRQGLEQARNGFVQLMTGVLKNSNDLKYDKTYRIAIVKALTEAAPDLISTLPLEMRSRVRTLATANRDSMSADIKPYLDRIYQALDNKECIGLCAI